MLFCLFAIWNFTNYPSLVNVWFVFFFHHEISSKPKLVDLYATNMYIVMAQSWEMVQIRDTSLF